MGAPIANYFAYGSNMSLARLQQRVPSAVSIGTYRLPGYELRFHKSGRDGSAKCDAFFTGDPDSFVYGRVFTILKFEKPALDRAEGVGNGYNIKEVTVYAEDGSRITPFIYLATQINTTLHPFHWYKQHVLVGAREAGLPDLYAKTIEAIPAIADPDVDRAHRELTLYS